jgi:hypothetical protein
VKSSVEWWTKAFKKLRGDGEEGKREMRVLSRLIECGDDFIFRRALRLVIGLIFE